MPTPTSNPWRAIFECDLRMAQADAPRRAERALEVVVAVALFCFGLGCLVGATVEQVLR